jgi:hypothetical protein
MKQEKNNKQNIADHVIYMNGLGFFQTVPGHVAIAKATFDRLNWLLGRTEQREGGQIHGRGPPSVFGHC